MAIKPPTPPAKKAAAQKPTTEPTPAVVTATPAAAQTPTVAPATAVSVSVSPAQTPTVAPATAVSVSVSPEDLEVARNRVREKLQAKMAAQIEKQATREAQREAIARKRAEAKGGQAAKSRKDLGWREAKPVERPVHLAFKVMAPPVAIRGVTMKPDQTVELDVQIMGIDYLEGFKVGEETLKGPGVGVHITFEATHIVKNAEVTARHAFFEKFGPGDPFVWGLIGRRLSGVEGLTVFSAEAAAEDHKRREAARVAAVKAAKDEKAGKGNTPAAEPTTAAANAEPASTETPSA